MCVKSLENIHKTLSETDQSPPWSHVPIGQLYNSITRRVWCLFPGEGFTYSVEELRSAIPALPLFRWGREAFNLAIKPWQDTWIYPLNYTRYLSITDISVGFTKPSLTAPRQCQASFYKAQQQICDVTLVTTKPPLPLWIKMIDNKCMSALPNECFMHTSAPWLMWLPSPRTCTEHSPSLSNEVWTVVRQHKKLLSATRHKLRVIGQSKPASITLCWC